MWYRMLRDEKHRDCHGIWGRVLVDVVGKERRSINMARIRSGDTKPEMAVRRSVHALGLRFRLHRRGLPGTPDLVFPRVHRVLFVNGCFWHRHAACRYAYEPKSRIAFWQGKFASNVARDSRVNADLNNLGWDVVTVWECETKDASHLRQILRERLHVTLS